MVIYSQNPSEVQAVDPSWCADLPPHTVRGFSCWIGSVVDIPSPHIVPTKTRPIMGGETSSDVTCTPGLAGVVKIIDADYREARAVPDGCPTQHSIQVRTGRGNDLQLVRNILLNSTLRMLDEGASYQPTTDSDPSILAPFNGPGLIHRDSALSDDESRLSYTMSNSFGSLHFAKRFWVPRYRHREKGLSNMLPLTIDIALLSIQALFTEHTSQQEDNILYRLDPRTDVHRKAGAPYFRRANRVFFRDFVKVAA